MNCGQRIPDIGYRAYNSGSVLQHRKPEGTNNQAIFDSLVCFLSNPSAYSGAMFALPKVAFSAVILTFNAWCQSVSGPGIRRNLSSSQITCKFTRSQPTDAELLEMPPALRRYYQKRIDPAFRQDHAAKARLAHARLQQQHQDDPEYQKNQQARWREYNRKYQNDDGNRRRKSFRLWLQRIPESQRNAYSWKTHRPIILSEPQRLTCDVCLVSTARSTLWWERIVSQNASGTSDIKQYTCHSCYMDQEASDVLPRGLENYVIGSGARLPKS